MHISWKWLQNLVCLQSITPSLLHEKLTLAGFEIENIICNDLDDYIFDVKVTTNRTDFLSMVGVAREVSAVLQRPLFLSSTQNPVYIKYYSIQNIPCSYRCFAYSQVMNLRMRKSPNWLKYRLTCHDISVQNNYLDVLNFIQIKWGFQFKLLVIDLNTNITDPSKLMKSCFYHLDEVNVKQDLDGVLCIDIPTYVELKSLNPLNFVDLNSKSTQSHISYVGSYADLLHAYNETTCLMNYLYNADIGPLTYFINPPKQYHHVVISKQFICQILGNGLSVGYNTDIALLPIVNRILLVLCFHTIDNMYDLLVTIPEYRIHDVFRSIDIIEEISRIYGFDKFQTNLPYGLKLYCDNTKINRRIDYIRSKLRDLGLSEVLHYSLIPNDVKHLNVSDVVLCNPLNQDYELLRNTLIPGIISANAYNLKQGNGFMELFEIGKVFQRDAKSSYYEKTVVAGLFGGGLLTRYDWSTKQVELNWFQAKGNLLQVFEQLMVDIQWETSSSEQINLLNYKYGIFFNNKRTALLKFQSSYIGIFGQVNSYCSEHFNISLNSYLFEIDLSSLLVQFPNSYHMNAYSKYPCITRDLAVRVAEDVKLVDILNIISTAQSLFIESINLFDYYSVEQDSKLYKNLGFRVKYRSQNSTLTHQKADQLDNQLLNALKHQLLYKIL